MLEKSRFNPAPGILDFWSEFKKPNPYRVPILIVSALPFALIFYALGSETYYGEPERPTITYITTFNPDRTDEEIIATNIANQEVKDLRAARDAELAQNKRDLYKALGAAAGMDVEEIERRADEERAAEEAAEEARRDEMFGRTDSDSNVVADTDADAGADEAGSEFDTDESPAP